MCLKSILKFPFYYRTCKQNLGGNTPKGEKNIFITQKNYGIDLRKNFCKISNSFWDIWPYMLFIYLCIPQYCSLHDQQRNAISIFGKLGVFDIKLTLGQYRCHGGLGNLLKVLPNSLEWHAEALSRCRSYCIVSFHASLVALPRSPSSDPGAPDLKRWCWGYLIISRKCDFSN